MEIRPILSALLRNRAGAILVALQIAITLAIVVNAIYVTNSAWSKIGRPTGLDDQNIFSFWMTSFEKNYDFLGMVREDMAALRQMPGIVEAAPINQMPLSGSGSSTAFYSLPGKKGETSPANYYATDEHGAKALGVTLSAGATSTPTRSNTGPRRGTGMPGPAVVTPGAGDRAVQGPDRRWARLSTTTRAIPSGWSA